MSYIEENPFRQLGVFSNASKKEIVANQGKIKAFLTTGRQVSFDTDFNAVLSPVIRNEETLAKAVNDIALPKDWFVASLFWFVNQKDDDAFNYLRTGNIEKAAELFYNKPTIVSNLNMAVICMILERWSAALFYYSRIFNKVDFKILSIALNGEFSPIDENEAIRLFANRLTTEYANVNWVECMFQTEIQLWNSETVSSDFLSRTPLCETIKRFCSKKTEKTLEDAVSSAEKESKNDALSNLRAAEWLTEISKKNLKSLHLVEGRQSNKCVVIADKIAVQILDNCIRYYNQEKEDTKKARSIIKLLKYALRIAEGELAKKRCQDNYNYIKKECDSLLPEEIEDENRIIDNQIADFRKMLSMSDNCIQYLNATIGNCYKHLEKIRLKLGEESIHYVNISSKIVSFALDEAIAEVNKQMKRHQESGQSEKYAQALVWTMSIFSGIENFKKNAATNERFYESKKQLVALRIRLNSQKVNLHQSTIAPTSTRQHNSHSGRPTSYTQPKRPQPATNSSNVKNNSSDKGYVIFAIFILIVFGIVIWTIAHMESNPQTQPRQTERLQESSVNNDSEEADTIVSDVYTEDTYADETTIENNWLEQYKDNSLRTGATPYQDKYGKNAKNGNAKLTITAPINSDVLVIIKNKSGYVVKHAYIQASDTYSFTMKAGTYQPFFVFGNSWCPEKTAPNGELGYFLESVSISKDEFQKIGNYQELQYTLQEVKYGNFHAETSNPEEAF